MNNRHLLIVACVILVVIAFFILSHEFRLQEIESDSVSSNHTVKFINNITIIEKIEGHGNAIGDGNTIKNSIACV